MTGPATVAVDTSVAVPLLVQSHPSHDAVVAWASGRRLSTTAHSLAETFAVLTRLPGDARVHPSDAARLIDDSLPDCLVLTAGRAGAVHRVLSGLGLSGGATYDGLVALTALDNDAELATRDARARSTYDAVGVRVLLLVDDG